MKRTSTILIILFISFLPFSFAIGQEKKNEHKIKVVIADKEGTNVVIDTAFTDANTADSVIVKGDNVIYVTNHDRDNGGKSGKQYKVIARVDKDGDNTESQYIYINDDKEVRDISDDKFDIRVSDDEFDNNTDKTKYVIAKNGITVSIEGNDEVKIKELVKEIEKRLDVEKEDTSSKPVIKETETKIIRKK
jgi:cellulose synthase/poly-beta-1,6-N-acetylglucosamine synthase-like glycosyltransferase